MRIKPLTSGLIFWQETAFVIPLGILLIEMTANHSIAFRQIIDTICFCFFLILFVCLIGQFFWKNQALAVTLSILLGASSLLLFFAALYALNTSPEHLTSIAMLILALFLVIAAITMPYKFNSKMSML
ncbi:MAG: hypothetical protein JNL51_14925 [Chitinophagaceae bacterium]|nr:hypothetical protein [Chitinophagaceae bacterium]